MEGRPSRADTDAQLARAKAVERLRFEMVAQREEGCLALERPAVMRCHGQREMRQYLLGFGKPFGRHDDLRGTDPCEFVLQLFHVGKFGHLEVARCQIHEREPEFAVAANCRQEIVTLRLQQMRVEVRAGTEDLCDIAFDEFPRLGFFELVADGHLAPVLEKFADVPFGGVVRDATHRGTVAAGEREVEQLRSRLRIVEKHLVEIAQPEQEQRIRRNLVLYAPVLLHHGRETVARLLGFRTRHRGGDYSGALRVVTS